MKDYIKFYIKICLYLGAIGAIASIAYFGYSKIVPATNEDVLTIGHFDIPIMTSREHSRLFLAKSPEIAIDIKNYYLTDSGDINFSFEQVWQVLPDDKLKVLKYLGKDSSILKVKAIAITLNDTKEVIGYISTDLIEIN